MKLLTRCSVILIATLLSLPANAETFRCDGKIIEEGMTQEEVLEHCGPPERKNYQTHYYWVYDQGAGRLKKLVYFYANGEVEKIESERD